MPEEEKKKIIIIDDAQFLIDVHASAFREAGFEVEVAHDGQEAWEKIEGGYRPDVVFTGILMPRMTGFDLIRKMQERDDLKDIPVAVSSHRGREEDKKTAGELAVDDFIVQGLVPLHEVIRRVQELVGSARTSYLIALERAHHDGEALVRLLNKQQNTYFGSDPRKEIFLELKPLENKSEFSVRIKEKDPENE
jgi:CheY-like chemotaxis protein